MCYHSESLNELNTQVDVLLKKFDKLYCRDKKLLLHYYPLKALYDINTPPTTYIRPTTPTHDLYNRKYKDNPELNLIIPIVKHYELCQQIFWDLKDNINKKKTEYNEFFNNIVSVVFNAIERSGIQIHRDKFKEHFYDESGPKVYTQYNLKDHQTNIKE